MPRCARKAESPAMADEIRERLLEQVKEQGELVRKLKAAKADNTEVKPRTFNVITIVLFGVSFTTNESAIPSGDVKPRRHVLNGLSEFNVIERDDSPSAI